MTCLNAYAIKSRMSSDLDQRLIVSPLLNIDEQVKDSQASVDLRLGFEFALVTPSAFRSIDELDENANPSFEHLYRREYVPFGSSIVIHPHQFILATSLEYIRLPSDLIAYVVGRSTWGRLGLIVATAVGIHPYFAGSLTLELRNLGETPLTLYPGQTIAQLFFHEIEQTGDAATSGQYGGTVDMIPQRISSAQTADKLRKLRENFQTLST